MKKIIDQLICNIEKEYINFCKQNTTSLNFSDIEFLGINFSDDKEVPTFKIYHRTKKDFLKIIPFFKPLYEHDMIGFLNMIDDNINNNKIRCEIGLKNRTNKNMCWLYRWIDKQFFLSSNCKTEIKKLKKLKCCNLKNYQYSSMYFLGFIISLGIDKKQANIDAIKLHYILRYCENPNDIGHNFLVNNEQSITHLRSIESPILYSISEMIEYLLKNTNMEIWMTAIDYYKDGIIKYKIYIKNLQDVLYEKLFFLLKKNNHIDLSNKILAYVRWLKAYPAFEKYGMAICCTNLGVLSVNFYH